MKKTLPLFLLTLLFACSSGRDLVVDYDYSYRGTFKKYKTYAFMEHNSADKLTDQNAAAIKNEIKFRMKILGYEYTESKPDLWVIFKIYENNFKFKGYNQPDFKNVYEDSTQAYYSKKLVLENGTLLVLMNDRRKKTTAWQGYASGIKSESNLVNPRTLRGSIISIFDRYEVFANDGKRLEE